MTARASCAVVLFTCDLRVHDNAALAAAATECERVVPAFVLDEQLLGAVREGRRRLTRWLGDGLPR